MNRESITLLQKRRKMLSVDCIPQHPCASNSLEHAITLGDVLGFIAIGTGIVVVIGICVAILAFYANGFRD
jgi:hypothetical protein